jgi:hypothetical protein
MTQIVLASVAALGMAGIVLFGVTRVFRQRRITLVDLPELPAPPAEDKPGAGPTMQA